MPFNQNSVQSTRDGWMFGVPGAFLGGQYGQGTSVSCRGTPQPSAGARKKRTAHQKKKKKTVVWVLLALPIKKKNEKPALRRS
jgi:hypothetical protein